VRRVSPDSTWPSPRHDPAHASRAGHGILSHLFFATITIHVGRIRGIVRGQLGHHVENQPDISDAAVPSFAASGHIDVSGLSHPGKVRARNEDHFIVMRIGRYLESVLTSLPPGEVPERAEENGYAMIVADGMGGHAGGELASRLAITGLVKLVLAMPDWIFHVDDEAVAEDATQRSKRRFRLLNSLLIERGRQDPAFRGMGTTLTAARNLGRNLHIVHVGDSRVYLFREGRVHRLTRDHTYVQLLVDTGQLSKKEAAAFGARHLLVNALGGSDEEVEVDVDQLELASGDRLLLCSDGLTDLVDDDNIREVLGESGESAVACRRLMDIALERGGRDNVTVVVASYTFPAAST
jgi:serine/threonine protein phosphatase PrpC